jgi:hypothetical protein
MAVLTEHSIHFELWVPLAVAILAEHLELLQLAMAILSEHDNVVALWDPPLEVSVISAEESVLFLWILNNPPFGVFNSLHYFFIY